MTSALDRGAARVRDLLGELADRPGSLLCLLLLANALVLPYLDLCHDSRLYGVQIVERLHPGAFQDDLYLRYGSQDGYSVFTQIVTPLVALLGLKSTFFVLYLASKALLFWGLLKLIQALIPDRPVAALVLIYLAVVGLPIGGNDIFHVNESFLTPRLASCGLVLLGLHQVLIGRAVRASVLLAAALLVHPLMAPAGILVAVAYGLFRRLSVRQLLGVGLAVILAAGFCLAYHPLGARLFGTIDDEWRSSLLDMCYFINPAEWSVGDWIRLCLRTIILVFALCTYARTNASFLLAVLVVGLAGLAGSFVAVHLHYLLLYQVSPYRTLWLLEPLAIALALWGFVQSWRQGSSLQLLLLPVLVLALVEDWSLRLVPEVVLLLVTLLVALIFCRGLARVPRHADWPRRTAAWALTGSVVALSLYNLAIYWVLFSSQPTFECDLHPIQILRVVPGFLYRLPTLVQIVLLAACLVSLVGARRRFVLTCLVLWLSYQTTLTTAGNSSWYQQRFSAGYRDWSKVVAYLHEKAHELQRKPTVYWPTDLRDLWFHAEVKSYFNTVQLSGCGFNRGTALEGKRRGLLVRRFELAGMRRWMSHQTIWGEVRCRFLEIDPNDPGAEPEDLLRLCQDSVDVVVLEEAFEDLYCARFGPFYVYDCAQLRSLQPRLPGGSPVLDLGRRLARSPLKPGSSVPLE